MKVGLFIPCYINQYYPQVGIACWNLLSALGFELHYPKDQTCCGQPLANSGFAKQAENASLHFNHVFEAYDTIVAPSASCVLYLKQHATEKESLTDRIFELSEFLVRFEVLNKIEASYPKKVGILKSCHGLRGLGLGKPSELVGGSFCMIEQILSSVKGLTVVRPDRADDCCGFGGTFSTKEPDLSVKMGNDRIHDFMENGAEVITGTDVSCLMHLEGIIKKRAYNIEVKHFSEILIQP